MEWAGVVAVFAACCVVAVVAVGSGAPMAGAVGENGADIASTPPAGPMSGTGPVGAPDAFAAEPAGAMAVQSDRRRQPGAGPLGVVTTQEFDRTEFRIRITEDGDAEWVFRFRRVLDTDEERDGFEEFAEQFRTNETEFYLSFREQAVNLADAGENATGREMAAIDFERSAKRSEEFGNEFGIVEIRFEWTNFGVQTDNGGVEVGDVFEGTMFIGESQRLVFEAGDGLRFQSVAPEGIPSGDSLAESDAVTWEGQREFVDGRPRAVLVPTDAPAGTGGTTGGEPGSSIVTPISAIAGLLFVALLVAGGFALHERGLFDREDGADEGTPTPVDDGTEDDGPAEPAISDEELLTDEDRVVQLIEERGGRMKQVDIVEETGWSKSKVSMLLSDMEDEETVSKIRVGRENIIALKGHEPEVAGSPFDDE